jgi:hypothetical protein
MTSAALSWTRNAPFAPAATVMILFTFALAGAHAQTSLEERAYGHEEHPPLGGVVGRTGIDRHVEPGRRAGGAYG